MSQFGPLEALRSATAHGHRQLEAVPSSVRLLSDDYRMSEYRELLQRLYGLYEPLATAMSAGEPAGIWSGRVAARAEALRRDLFDLGVGAEDLERIARCAALPDLQTADDVLGCAYVLEGSNLGGRVIHKHLCGVFAGEPVLPLRFFAGDGTQTAAQWRTFCAAVDAQTTNVEELCRAACVTFEAVHDWLEQRAPAAAAAQPRKPVTLPRR
jgi:heme oxygenase